MKRSDRPPDYLIDRIARHADVLVKMQPTNTREANAMRLLKQEIRKLVTYKQKKRWIKQEKTSTRRLRCTWPKADNGLYLF